MRKIKVLGGCCGQCDATLRLVEDVAREKGVAVALEKIVDLQEIVRYGVLSTPGVVVDGKVVHSGSVPERGMIAGWLQEAAGRL